MELGEATRPQEELFCVGRLRLVTATVTPGQLGAAATIYTLGDDEAWPAWPEEEESSFGQFFAGPFRRSLRRFLGRR